MTEIININVVQKTIEWTKKRFVNARELHKWLWVWKFFANWIKDRIKKYDFIENLDYFITVANSGNGVKARSDGQLINAKTGKVIPKEYVISIFISKKLESISKKN